MILNQKQLKKLACVLFVVFVSVLSIFVCSRKVPEMKFFTQSVERLDSVKDTVMNLSAATLAVSVGITLLPDDYASPIANTLADMNKYFILILGTVFLEKILVLECVPFAFLFMVPLACCLLALFFITGRELFKSFAEKLLVLALAIVLIVPTGTWVSNVIYSDYMAYVEETISVAEKGTDKLDEISTPEDDDQSVYERISGLFQTVITGVKDLFDYFSAIVKKCINSVAILIVVSCGIPLLTFLLFVWLIKQLFQIQGLQILSDRIIKTSIKDRIESKKKEAAE